MYDLQSQGIPLIFPIDQDAVIRAIQNDAPFVKPFMVAYAAMFGFDNILRKWEEGTLDFAPDSSIHELIDQSIIMGKYIDILLLRARQEGIDLNEYDK